MPTSDESKASDELPVLPSVPGLDELVPQAGAAKPNPNNLSVDLDESSRIESAESGDLPGMRPSTITPASEPQVISGDDPYLGKQFGGYEMVQKIGQGGMGLVYKGRQVSLDRVVAVKILSKSLCDNPEFIKRFEREAKSIARVNHPNILAVYDFGKTDGVWYMVAEFVEGSSLSRQISERLVIPWDEAAPLIMQCLAGLSYVGQSGIVHRDIKPDNILITRDGVAKIADFGLAKDVTGNDNTDLTTVGMAMGTPAYMSPEQCMGRKLDGRSDIYSLGITVYLALTGEKPFIGQSSFEIMTRQREHNPPPPRQLNPNIPKEISDLVMRMLAKNPSDRWRDAEDCRLAWQEVFNHLHAPGGAPPAARITTPPSGTVVGPENAERPVPAKRRSGEFVVGNLPPSIPASVAPPEIPPTKSAAGSSVRSTPGTEPLRPPPLRRNTQEIRMPSPAEVLEAPAKPGSERQQRPTTEKRLSQRMSTVIEASTCPKCGMLNRADTAMCSRCQHPLHEAQITSKDQEQHADRLAQQGNHREAAAIYARLSEREQDKRVRSVLRTKEREARNHEQQQQVHDLHARSQGLIQRGDLQGGVEMLERGLKDVREGATSSTGAESFILEELNQLRSRMRRRRLNRILVVIVILITLALAVLMYLKPGTAPVTPIPPVSEPVGGSAEPGR